MNEIEWTGPKLHESKNKGKTQCILTMNTVMFSCQESQSPTKSKVNHVKWCIDSRKGETKEITMMKLRERVKRQRSTLTDQVGFPHQISANQKPTAPLHDD
jgi:hypothetical protein